MASTTDARAAGFDLTEFRSAIEFVMGVAAPEDEDQRVKFVFEEEVTYDTADKTDTTGLPYDLTAEPALVNSSEQIVEVPYAADFVARTSQGRDVPAGFVLPSRLEVYISDTYIDEVKDADYATVNGDRYTITAWGPPVGLFGYTLHTCFLEANDQSGDDL